MKLYSIKSCNGDESYCSVLQETEAGYILHICIDKEGYKKETEEFIEKELFNICLKTGYIKEIKNKAEVVA